MTDTLFGLDLEQLLQGPPSMPKVLEVHLTLANFPILADRIRERMRQEIFARNIVSAGVFEQEVEDKAVVSQRREGLENPYTEETSETWERRKHQVRDLLTDFYFAYNLQPRLLYDIIQSEVGRRVGDSLAMTFNPELAPWDVLFAKGLQYEALPADRQSEVQHHLAEIKVVLIKAMISDHLGFVGIAKRFLTMADLVEIRQRRIGRGKIGGKAAGLMLASKILARSAQAAEAGLVDNLAVPESFFIGADVFYSFLEINGLLELLNQKYKTTEQIIADYDDLPEIFAAGRFPDRIVDDLREVLERLGPVPLIVRSSSLLEDNLSTSFAGKYESVFCPNQRSPEQNLSALLRAITQVYASALNPDALLYRQRMGLVDYDERMAIIIQPVQGSRFGRYFFPTVAGVGFGRNPFLWTPRLKREEGFVRLVTGLGTRAVDRVADDYPRMVGLSHPQLRPAQAAHRIQHYSQHFMDLVDLETNQVVTLPVNRVLNQQYPWLRLMAVINRGTYIEPIVSAVSDIAPEILVLTLDGLLERTPFVERMKVLLRTLEEAYESPVDVEFTVELQGSRRNPEVIIHLLQCRPQSRQEDGQDISLPADASLADTLFTADYLVPNGIVDGVRFVVFVDPVVYAGLALPSEKLEVARVVGRLNRALQGEDFIIMGPGRWGSSNPDLGVKVTYADIFNTRMLIEIGLDHGSGVPDVSHGTHFFQDLVEARIFPLAIFPDRPGNRFDWDFLRDSPNQLPVLLPADAALAGVIRVIEVPVVRPGQRLEVIMSGEQGRALAHFQTQG